MAYDVNTLTLKGAELLAAATAADKLILDGCDATATYIDTATAAAVSSRPGSPLSNTTDVSLIGYTAEHVQARAAFVAGSSTGGDANTLYLYGHKESAPSDIYVIYVASSTDPFHLPEVGDVANVYETLFDIIYAINSGAVTTAGTSTYCTLAEFNMLKERAVTMHKEGILNEGDNQTIYGEKTFKDRVEFSDSSVTFRNYAYFAKDLRIVSGNNVNIGQSTDPFDKLYVNDIVCDSITATDNIVTSQVMECYGFYCYVDAHITDDVYIGGGLEVGGNIEPDSNLTAQLGTYNYPFKYLYAGGLMTYKAFSYSYIGRAVSEGSEPSQKIAFSDSSPYKISIQSTNAIINISSTGTTVGCECNVSFGGTKQVEIAYNNGISKYETTFSIPVTVSDLITCDGITGQQPTYASSTRTLKVGSIIRAWVSGSNDLPVMYTGEVYTQGSSNQKFYFAYLNNSVVLSANVVLPAGKYALLSDLNATNYNSWCLVQCLSLD